VVIAVGTAAAVSHVIELMTGRDLFEALILCLALGWVVLRIVLPWARSRLGPPGPRVRILRALRAEGAGLPHYFLETVTDDGRRGMTHLSGLWLLKYEPSVHAARRFPCREVEVDALRPVGWGTAVRSTRMVCVGDLIEPQHAGREVTADAASRGYLARDWELLPVGYDELCEYFGASATASAEAPSSPRRETSEHEIVPAAPGRDEEGERHEDLAPVDVAEDRSSAQEAMRPRTPPGRLVPVQRYAAVRALRVEEKGRHGPHYFVLLEDGAVLHLNGRYLRGYEPRDDRPRVFPCTVFEPTEGRSNMDCIGEPFEPDVARRPVGPADRATGFVTDDWMLLDRSYEDLLEHFGAGPAASKGPAEGPGTAQHVTAD
jgi:hypothetical protein